MQVVTFVHREALYVMSPTGIWRIKDDGRRLVPEALKPLSWDGHKVVARAVPNGRLHIMCFLT